MRYDCYKKQNDRSFLLANENQEFTSTHSQFIVRMGYFIAHNISLSFVIEYSHRDRPTVELHTRRPNTILKII